MEKMTLGEMASKNRAMTSKEQMSDYLERMQTWQRMLLCICPVHIETAFVGELATISLWICTPDNKKFKRFRIEEWNDESTNNLRMREAKQYIDNIKMIFLSVGKK
jgi:DNA modification methylase